MGIVYRPNSAKVKNLKTKDYLGKARLIASSDNTNTSTGFAGPEIKRNMAAAVDFSRDDRPLENISFAASNLVKPDIRSRTRQQSEPPINRNIMFPPTPPPDHDQPVRPIVTATQTSLPTNPAPMTGRANSVRNPPTHQRLDLSKQGLSKPALDKELPRLGTMRTASEPGGPRRNYYSSRSDRDPARRSRGRLFMETTPLRRSDDGDEADIDEYPEELYQLYRQNRNSKDAVPPSMRAGSSTRVRSRSRQRPRSIDEVDEDVDADAPPYSGSSVDGQFDLLNNPPPSRRHRIEHPQPRPRSRSRGGARSNPRRPVPDIRNIRVKVHSGDDTRYIIITVSVGFDEFADRVREKFGIRQRFKLKVKDEEGDLITLGDRDDWEMGMGMCRKEARRAAADVGKMEVSLTALFIRDKLLA